MGSIVKASKHLDKEGANVVKGQIGIVFGEYNCYEDRAGPIVQWFKPEIQEDYMWFQLILFFDIPEEWKAGVCNIYQGWVEVLTRIDTFE